MTKRRTISTALAALILLASPGVAGAAGQASAPPPKTIKSDTSLKLGQKGVVKIRGFEDRSAPVGMTVVKIVKGKPSDLDGQGLPASTRGMVPYYIRVVFSYEGKNYRGVPSAFGGKFSDGSRAGLVATSADFAPCGGDPIVDVSAQRRTARKCDVVLAPRGVPVVAAEFIGSTATKLFTVTWRK